MCLIKYTLINEIKELFILFRAFGSEVINGTFFAVGFIAVKLKLQLQSAKII